MNKLTITIVIPAYNEAEQIGQCLDSIAAQRVAPNQVIVVNNNSSDATATIAKQYKFASVIDEEQQGIVFARNAGFNHSTSDLVARIDADTNLPPNWTEMAKNLAEYLPRTDAVTGPCQFRDVALPKLFFGLHRLVYFWSSRALLGHRTLFGSNMFLWRENWLNLRKVTCQQTDIHEDMDLAIHLVQNGGQIQFCKQLSASISPRRWRMGGNYPKMWFNTKHYHKVVGRPLANLR